MKIIIEVTPEEAAMIGYALKEMGSKRAEQAIDRDSADLMQESRAHFALANRIYAAREKS